MSLVILCVFASPLGTLALVNMAAPGDRSSRAATTVPLPISVRTKVCRYKDGVFTDGVVIEIKTSKARKQKVTLKCYVIQFDGLEQLVCDEDTVRMLMACYASRKNKGRTTVAQLPVTNALVPDGYHLYTMWTPELHPLSPGCKPPPFRTGKFDSWLRTAKILKYHPALDEYEIEYACGYGRFVNSVDMQNNTWIGIISK